MFILTPLLLLKHLENLSDEVLVQRWAQDPYYQAFTGDQINLVMSAAAFNFKKWMREVAFWLKKLKQMKVVLEIFFLRCNVVTV